MKICILDDNYEDSSSPLKEHDPPDALDLHLGEHDRHRVVLRKTTAIQQLIQLARQDFDVFINLCDGAWDEDRPGIEVVQALEKIGLAFTGATSSFYEPSREAMKIAGHYAGIAAPAYVHARTEDALERAAGLRFPLIVKHPNSYGSVALTRASRVETPEAMQEQGRRMIAAFGSALVEEFIEGREFTVLVAEHPDAARPPTVYTPVEFRFPEGETFKHFDLKWVDYHGMTAAPCRDEALTGQLKEVSRRFFTAIGGTGYGRCDFRMNADGELFMLEINPNCGMFYPPEDAGSADFILLNDPAGHTGFIAQILEVALARRRKTVEVGPSNNGFGLFARSSFAQSDVILRHEETPHVLVSLAHVKAHWSETRKMLFDRTAWPLTAEVWVTRPEDLEAWRPVNHACDPNAWLDGLDLVARRPIAPGEEITLDYATRYNEVMPAFTCRCGAAACRGTIRGTDYREPFVACYGPHVSEYVRRKRESLGLP